MLRIKNGNVFVNGTGFEKSDVLVDNGRIIGICQNTDTYATQTIDADGCYVVPGFIDIHTHGAYGVDIMSASCNNLDELSHFYASQGVTSFLPTTMTLPVLRIVKTLETINQAIEKGVAGAKILGVNLEGPFINRNFKGAHPEEYIMYPSLELIESLVKKSNNKIKMITMAPELEGAENIVEYLKSSGIILAIGHSELNFKGAQEAFKCGITHVTHLFNAMIGVHHREPGLAGAALDCDDVTVELIADGIHIHPSVIRMVVKCKSPEKVALVTDSTVAAGLSDGQYFFAERQVIVKNKEARLPNGVLAGSMLTMADAVRNMAKLFGIPLEHVLIMASETPARILKINNAKGRISVGYDADITILDENLEVKMTIVEGQVVFRR